MDARNSAPPRPEKSGLFYRHRDTVLFRHQYVRRVDATRIAVKGGRRLGLVAEHVQRIRGGCIRRNLRDWIVAFFRQVDNSNLENLSGRYRRRSFHPVVGRGRVGAVSADYFAQTGMGQHKKLEIRTFRRAGSPSLALVGGLPRPCLCVPDVYAVRVGRTDSKLEGLGAGLRHCRRSGILPGGREADDRFPFFQHCQRSDSLGRVRGRGFTRGFRTMSGTRPREDRICRCGDFVLFVLFGVDPL